jgi:hypothetical protein
MSTRNSAVVALVAAVLMAAGFSVRAQFGGRRGRNRVPQTSELLQSVKRLKCSFPMKADDPIVSIDRIDAEEGTAQVAGFLRRDEDVTVKLVGSNMHFFNVGIDGGLSIVTVFAKETHDGRLQAVYSRAAYPEAAQYMGDCEATR